jgi:hypothetical protein
MSAIGREGGHSRGRTRQPGLGDTGAMDTERQNYIGHGNDRGTFDESNRGASSPSQRQESGNDFRDNNNANRGSF